MQYSLGPFKASVDQVSVDAIGRYGGLLRSRFLGCRRRLSIWRPTLGRYIDRHLADMSADCGWRVGRHEPTSMSADTRPILHRHSADTLPTLGQH